MSTKTENVLSVIHNFPVHQPSSNLLRYRPQPVSFSLHSFLITIIRDTDVIHCLRLYNEHYDKITLHNRSTAMFRWQIRGYYWF